MKNQQSKKKLIPFLIGYFILSIISEQFFRNPLFEYSYETFEPTLQNKIGKDNFLTFIFTIASFLGRNISVFGITFIICFFFYSYQEIIISLMTIFTSVSLVGYLKILYHNPRPYWINDNIKLIDDLGYGNPSGHSFTSSTGYLCIFYLISNNPKFKKNNFLYYFFYFITLIWVFIIMFSRLYFAAHSINQVIFGFLLGCGIFILFFSFFQLQNYSTNDFFKVFDEKKQFVIPICLIYLFSILIPYFLVKEPDINTIKVDKKIPNYRIFNAESIYAQINIVLILGCYLGILFVNKKINDDNLNDEEKNNILGKYENNEISLIDKLLRLFINFIFCLPGLFFLLPFDNLILVFIFKIGLPFFLTAFSFFGPGIYYSYYFIEKRRKEKNQELNKISTEE